MPDGRVQASSMEASEDTGMARSMSGGEIEAWNKTVRTHGDAEKQL